jgi:hypothetical protein
MNQNPETQAIESSLLNEWEIKFFPIFHSHIHSRSKAWARTTSRVRGKLCGEAQISLGGMNIQYDLRRVNNGAPTGSSHCKNREHHHLRFPWGSRWVSASSHDREPQTAYEQHEATNTAPTNGSNNEE